jgi:putative ABC transport system permease protein
MKALDRKLLRDLKQLWSQVLTIALVVASGVAGFVTSLSAVDSLAAARDRFYDEAVFADVFASARRAPVALAPRLREIEGVAEVQTTVEQYARVTVPGISDPVIGQLVGLDWRDPPRLNRVLVRRGRALDHGTGLRPDGSLEALVSEAFFEAHHLALGARLDALIEGHQRHLVVVGTALSPEFVFAGLWGTPDARGFGVFWVDHDALAAACGLTGAFNRAALRLAPGAVEARVVDALARALAPYGGREAHGRADQPSNAMLDNEIKEQHVMGTVLPAVFLLVAGFLLNVVVARLVATQREQIAALKALGYTNLRIGVHFLEFVMVIVAAGVALGAAVGDPLGGMLTRLYAEFFRFPSFEHQLSPALVATAGAVTLAMAVVGTVNAIAATVRLPPAEAMRPPSPGRYRRTLLERLGVKGMSPALRMIVRNMERRPVRTVMSVAGVAAAVAIVIMGRFFGDAIDSILDTQLRLGLRGDVTVWTTDPVDDAAARASLARVPGVVQVEATRFAAVEFRNGSRHERGIIRGYAGRPELYRVVDADRRPVAIEGRDLVLTDRLADKLGVAVGDTLRVEVLEGRTRTLALRVGGLVRETMGLNAYMDRRELDRRLGDGDVSGGFVLQVDRGREADVLEATKAMPRVVGAFSKATMLRNVQEISARNVRIMGTLLTTFAVVIAVGVVYNTARIALAERQWELASLRVLGFTRGEVSAFLLGELVATIALALPLGIALGIGMMRAIAVLLRSDAFDFPLVVRADSCAIAALCVVAAGAASALVVRRRIDRLDLVAALKARD